MHDVHLRIIILHDRSCVEVHVDVLIVVEVGNSCYTSWSLYVVPFLNRVLFYSIRNQYCVLSFHQCCYVVSALLLMSLVPMSLDSGNFL